MEECNVHNEVVAGDVVEYVATFSYGKSRLDEIEVLGVHQLPRGGRRLLLCPVVVSVSTAQTRWRITHRPQVDDLGTRLENHPYNLKFSQFLARRG